LTGIDTNVLVRYLIKDDPKQTNKAVALFRSLSPTNKGFISLVVIIESIWVLESVYKMDKTLIKEAILKLLKSPRLVIQSTQEIESALSRKEDSDDLADVIIAEIGTRSGCGYTVTFDKKAAKLPGMRLLDITDSEERWDNSFFDPLSDEELELWEGNRIT